MHNLNVLPEDLVPREPQDTDDVVMRVQLSMELERRRFEIIEKIMAERNRILSEPALDVLTSGFPTERQKKLGKKKKRMSPKKSTFSTISETPDMPSFKPIPPTVRRAPKRGTELTWERVKAAQERKLEAQREKQAIVEQKAKERMAKIQGDATTFEKRKSQLRAVAQSKFQRQQRTYMQLQENKRRQFEREQQERREKIYKETQRKNTFSQLKREFLAGGGIPDNRASQPPAPIIEAVRAAIPTKTAVTRSQELHPPPVISTKIIPAVRGSEDRRSMLARPAPVVKLPVVGKGKTKIPLYRR
jgi:hypothetical protein